MDLLAEDADLSCFVPPTFRSFIGFVPGPTVKKGQGSPVIETKITDNDVLLGRGKTTDCHNGNIHFRYIILKAATDNCGKSFSKKEKSFESCKIVAIIRNLKPPGRFLSKNEKTGYWEEVGDKVARKKVTQAFRDYRKATIRKVKEEENRKRMKPPGRFLSKNEKTEYWEEFGDIVAPEKVTQVSRDCINAAIKKVKVEEN